MYRVGSVLLVLILLLSGCSFFEKKEEADEAVVAHPDVEVLAEKLSAPWSIDKFRETFYLSERTGSIVKIENGKMERQQVQLEMPLAGAAEAGLLGFVLDPDFPRNQQAFAYYTYEDGSGGQFNRVVVLRFNGDLWREERILLDRIPSAAYHHGGRLKIGPDGKLYITTGDATTPSVAQKLNSLNGKILRMNVDGTVPSDNPFPNSYVYSYGHRNPQGLVWIGGKMLYASEHGQSAHDEMNRIVAGGNYGWPVIQGKEKKTGMKIPIFESGMAKTWAPSGMAAAGGKLYVATLKGNAVREFDLERKQTRAVVSDLGRIRDVFVDGEYLYFISNNTDGRGNPDEKDDKLYRVRLGELK